MTFSSDPTDATTEHFLAALDSRMRVELARTPAALPARTLLDAGGKRLRARILWWSANATAPNPVDPEGESLIRAATAVEFAHLGSLIHDDIVDGGDTRRGIATLHRQYGVRVATDAGAALAHLASGLVAQLGHPARRAVRRAILATCRGQIRELALPFVFVSPRMRLAIMQEKTAAFFELAAALGAIVTGSSRAHRAAVCRFARRFGVAFQIADDVLDIAGDPVQLGRPNGADLREGVMTLPILLATDPHGELARATDRLRSSFDEDELARCAELVNRGGGIARTQFLARWWLENAVHALSNLPTGRAPFELSELARAAIRRGIKPGQPLFETPPSSRLQSRDPSRIHPEASGFPVKLPTRLVGILNWFRPDLSVPISQKARDLARDDRRQLTKEHLLHNHPASPAVLAAADAIALAHSIAWRQSHYEAYGETLALIDALHCAAIGLLNDEVDPLAQELVAARLCEALRPEIPTRRPRARHDAPALDPIYA